MTQEEIRAEKKRLEAEQNRLTGLKRRVSEDQNNLQTFCRHPKKQSIDGIAEFCEDCGWRKSIYQSLED